jgi:hypothetical protein
MAAKNLTSRKDELGAIAVAHAKTRHQNCPGLPISNPFDREREADNCLSAIKAQWASISLVALAGGAGVMEDHSYP